MTCVVCNYSGTVVARILYHTSYEGFYISLSNDVGVMKFRQKIIKEGNLKAIFSLLFFEQEYIGNHSIYQVEIFNMYFKHSPLGKDVSFVI